MTITDAKAAELRALCEKATPGPWEVQPIEEDGFEKGSAFIVAANLGGLVGAAHAWPTEIDSGDWSRVKANAAFIASARTAIPALLNEREELIKERDTACFKADVSLARAEKAEAERDAANAERETYRDLCNRLVAERYVMRETIIRDEMTKETLEFQRDASLAREKVLREALEFYADEDSYKSPPPYLDTLVREDRGSVARAALKEVVK